MSSFNNGRLELPNAFSTHAGFAQALEAYVADGTVPNELRDPISGRVFRLPVRIGHDGSQPYEKTPLIDRFRADAVEPATMRRVAEGTPLVRDAKTVLLVNGLRRAATRHYTQRMRRAGELEKVSQAQGDDAALTAARNDRVEHLKKAVAMFAVVKLTRRASLAQEPELQAHFPKRPAPFPLSYVIAPALSLIVGTAVANHHDGEETSRPLVCARLLFAMLAAELNARAVSKAPAQWRLATVATTVPAFAALEYGLFHNFRGLLACIHAMNILQSLLKTFAVFWRVYTR